MSTTTNDDKQSRDVFGALLGTLNNDQALLLIDFFIGIIGDNQEKKLRVLRENGFVDTLNATQAIHFVEFLIQSTLVNSDKIEPSRQATNKSFKNDFYVNQPITEILSSGDSDQVPEFSNQEFNMIDTETSDSEVESVIVESPENDFISEPDDKIVFVKNLEPNSRRQFLTWITSGSSLSTEHVLLLLSKITFSQRQTLFNVYFDYRLNNQETRSLNIDSKRVENYAKQLTEQQCREYLSLVFDDFSTYSQDLFVFIQNLDPNIRIQSFDLLASQIGLFHSDAIMMLRQLSNKCTYSGLYVDTIDYLCQMFKQNIVIVSESRQFVVYQDFVEKYPNIDLDNPLDHPPHVLNISANHKIKVAWEFTF